MKYPDEVSALWTVQGAPSLVCVIKVINNLTRQDDSGDQEITGRRS